VVVAHQGGWDEMLLAAAPVAALAALLWVARRRVEREATEEGRLPPPHADH
jgi:hypothetical protein